MYCPEFITFIQSYDIIGVQETRTDEYDTINIPGYKVIVKHRSCTSKNRSGGIALLVKEHMELYIKVHEYRNSDLILPFSLSKVLSVNGVREDLHCGVVYIPPYGSKYSSEDPFLEVQECVLNCFQNSDNLILFGDFNSRTNDLQDFVEIDEYFSEMHGLQELHAESTRIHTYFETCHIPLKRNTADRNVNTYGRNMLEFCKNNNIFILNGRVGADYQMPKLTCKEKSTVDYFFVDSKCF